MRIDVHLLEVLVFGQVISFSILLYGSMRGENIRLHFRNIRINKHLKA